MPRFNTLDAWLAWQETLHPRAIDLGLDRVRRAAQALGVDRAQWPVITVGGTNGKGSAVAMLEAILSAHGHRVGAFTSPHLVHYNERVRVAGRLVEDAALVDAFARIDAARGDTSLTFFEFNTLAALLVFGEAGLDAVVLEVGLGGRLDAVNVLDADVALLMSVALDHTDWLGKSLEEIGREKAGIFRRGRAAVLGQASMPGSVFDAAAQAGADVRLPQRDFTWSVTSTGWQWRGRARELPGLPPPALAGDHQYDNAAAVLAALEALEGVHGQLALDPDAVAKGLAQVQLSGRFEVIPGSVEWIFDVAHNPAAARALAAALARRPSSGSTYAVLGVLSDKDAAGIVEAMAPHVTRWIAADLQGPRGMRAADLRKAAAAEGGAPWTQCPGVVAACEEAARLAKQGDRVVVFGSFHTVGPALEWRRRQPRLDHSS